MTGLTNNLADESVVSIPPCFRTKLFKIHQEFLNAFNIFEDQFEFLPQNGRPNENQDLYREIADYALKALTCISNTFQPNIGLEDLKRNIRTAEECLIEATLNCYKYSLAAFKVDLDIVYSDPQTSPCLIHISHADFQSEYGTFRAQWLNARESNRKNKEAISAFADATRTGIKLKGLINLQKLQEIMKQQAGRDLSEAPITITDSQVQVTHDAGIQVKNNNIINQISPKEHPYRFIGIAVFFLTSFTTAFINWILPKIFQATFNNTTNHIIQNLTTHRP